jgi:exodeoxyribonuclease V gamma subunit
MSNERRPGLVVLQGNRLEQLAAVVAQWLRRDPLPPLVHEVFLVQSHGMAEWLKMALAHDGGICASARMELPARFVWRAMRAVLGRDAVPAASPLDKAALTWRLVRLLPALHGAIWEPLHTAWVSAAQSAAESAADVAGAPLRRLRLAQRLADLYDQYQVYRADWLDDWAAGRDRLTHPVVGPRAAREVPADQLWQPALWRELLQELEGPLQQAVRPALHQRFIQALQRRRDPPWPQLPQRVVLFGTPHLPHQTMHALLALSAHIQVLLAVPNPCRYHWADTLDGRELLAQATRRQPLRGGFDLAQLPLQAMHVHGHPLLAAWGRQARDFVRQLDACEDAAAAAGIALHRVDLFDDDPGSRALQRLQAQVRDLVPLGEPPGAAAPPPDPDDRSIVFHIAHSAQREVEALHDALLDMLAQREAGMRPLQPRDIIVMVPDVAQFEPAIRSVFGQYARDDDRAIPWQIADLGARDRHPLLLALDWLLQAPAPRCTTSELRALLEVAPVARRLGLDETDLHTLLEWAAEAGARWGLDARHRAALGLDACGDANTWRFALRRMLLGWSAGELRQGHEGIEPLPAVAGLAGRLAGALDELLQRLQDWWRDAALERAPLAWAERLRELLQAFFAADEEADRAVLASVDDALAQWLEATELAGFDEAVPLAVVREAWLARLDAAAEPGRAGRLLDGGVTFCTLLPLRAIPFEVVCLLGMNEGDYPRRGGVDDFDLMSLPGQARAGDRSRRDDDRQLMLDAVLAARRTLLVSWSGRSVRDNEQRPPSVLVAQLRDHLCALWGEPALRARTVEHPLQPFSRRYFEAALHEVAQAPLVSHAREWRVLHEPLPPVSSDPWMPPGTGPAPVEYEQALTIDDLVAFLRNPVAAYFEHRLRVRFDGALELPEDDEPLSVRGLERWQWADRVLAQVRSREPATVESAWSEVHAAIARLRRAGELPLAGPGQALEDELHRELMPALARWQHERARWPLATAAVEIDWAHPTQPLWRVRDRVPGLREGEAGCAWVELTARRLTGGRPEKLRRDGSWLAAYVRQLVAAACGWPAAHIAICAQVHALASAPDVNEARAALAALMEARAAALVGDQPWPTAPATGLAWLADPATAAAVYDGGRFAAAGRPGEVRDPALARLYPDADTLLSAPGFEDATVALYQPLARWLDACEWAAHGVQEAA